MDLTELQLTSYFRDLKENTLALNNVNQELNSIPDCGYYQDRIRGMYTAVNCINDAINCSAIGINKDIKSSLSNLLSLSETLYKLKDDIKNTTLDDYIVSRIKMIRQDALHFHNEYLCLLYPDQAYILKDYDISSEL